jgi:hypothetical protein
VLAVAHIALFVGALVAMAVLTGGHHFPSPFAAPGDALNFLAANAEPVRWSAFLQVGAAVPLGLFAATVSSRLHFLGVRAAGATIALFGGVGASAFLLLSGAAQWALSGVDVLGAPGTARALQLLAFATGGPLFAMLLGLLVAGTAVTTGLHGLAPRWLMITGLAIAIAAELSWLSLITPAATWLVPLARFPALAWLVAAGALLPVERRSAPKPAPAGAEAGSALARPSPARGSA